MNAEFLTDPAFPGRHGFFTRRGGVSTGPYASLNASLSSADDPARVRQNRALVASALGVPRANLLGVTQVHGIAVAEPEAPWEEGQGPAADAIVSDRPGLALGVVTADCAPVLLRDPVAGVAGAVHAGWRGAVAGVLEAALAAMERRGARAARIAASVGPCIGQSSYEVGPELRDAVLPTLADAERFFAPGAPPDRWQFDLAGYVAARLAACGVRATVLGHDTFADEARFFSHRRRTKCQPGPIGHQLSVVVVEEGRQG